MKTVRLSKQYVVGSSIFDTVQLREPTLADYRAVGPVAERQGAVIIAYRDATFSYVDRLTTEPAPGALSSLSLEDAFAVEEAVNSFFSEARQSLNKRESSSSGLDGAPPT
jgi:hypothetical protein